MPNVKDCPGFETFGADVQQAREAVNMSRRELAKRVGIDPRYLANIETNSSLEVTRMRRAVIQTKLQLL